MRGGYAKVASVRRGSGVPERSTRRNVTVSPSCPELRRRSGNPAPGLPCDRWREWDLRRRPQAGPLIRFVPVSVAGVGLSSLGKDKEKDEEGM